MSVEFWPTPYPHANITLVPFPNAHSPLTTPVSGPVPKFTTAGALAQALSSYNCSVQASKSRFAYVVVNDRKP